MKINNKKAMEEKTFGMILVVVVMIALLVFYFTGLFPKIFSIGGELGAHIDLLGDPACRAQGELKKAKGIDFKDDDFDKRPDLLCDICVPATDTTRKGDNDKDDDADGVPDDCDAKPQDPRVGFCEVQGKDCSKSKCCTDDDNKKDGYTTQCGSGSTGTIKNIGTKKNPKYQCSLSS